MSNCLSWHSKTGKPAVPFTNDYLFHILVKDNKYFAEALISSVLRLKPGTIESLLIQDSVQSGHTAGNKEFIFDNHLLLNGHTHISLELQVVNYHDWPERSLSYLCRSFDRLSRGEPYNSTETAIHIGILDFRLFQDDHRLAALCRMRDAETGRTYSDKLQLYTIILPCRRNATETDKLNHLDIWSGFFKAKRWEDIRMLAKKYPVLDSVAQTASDAMEDDVKWLHMAAREDFLVRQKRDALEYKQMKKEKKHMARKINHLAKENSSLIRERDSALARIRELEAQLASKAH